MVKGNSTSFLLCLIFLMFSLTKLIKIVASIQVVPQELSDMWCIFLKIENCIFCYILRTSNQELYSDITFDKSGVTFSQDFQLFLENSGYIQVTVHKIWRRIVKIVNIIKYLLADKFAAIVFLLKFFKF